MQSNIPKSRWNAVVVLAIASVCSPQANAAVINVYADGTGSGCGLRDAIKSANTDNDVGACTAGSGADVLVLVQSDRKPFFLLSNAPGADEDASASGDLDITSVIAISGTDPASSVIVGLGSDRVFDVLAGGSLILSDVTVIGGSVVDANNDDGGVIRKRSGGSLSIFDSVLRDGRADVGGAIHAAGSGDLVLRGVTLFGNRARIGGALGLQMAAGETALLTNVTISGNTATTRGGGVFANGAVRMRNVTVARNVAAIGGGLLYPSAVGTTAINLANSVFVDNTADGVASDVVCSSNNVQLGARAYTMIGAIDGCSFASFIGVPASSDARLSPLFDAGGGIPVHVLLPGSAARNAGNPATDNENTRCQTIDARGAARSNPCDLGAYEERFDAIVDSFSDLPDIDPGDGVCEALGGACTLRALTMEAMFSPGRWFAQLPAGVYTLSRPPNMYNDVDAGDLDIRMDEPDVPTQVILYGVGDADDVRIVGGGFDRVLEVRARSGPVGDKRHDPLAFALLNATVEGGVLRDDPFEGDPNVPLVGGGIKVTGAKTLFHNVVVRDNLVESTETNATAGGMSIDVELESNVPNQFYRSSAVLDRFAVIDNVTVDSPGRNEYAGGMQVDSTNEFQVGDGVILRNGVVAGNISTNGGGIVMHGAVDASFLTVVDNVSDPLQPEGYPQWAGGLFVGGQNSLFRNVLVAGNRAGDVASDCGTNPYAGQLVSLGNNLIGATGSDCVISGELSSNLLNIDAMLGERIERRGMPAYVPLAASPVVDAVPPQQCIDVRGFGVVDDLLRTDRPAGSGCEIGAVEVVPPLLVDGFEAPN